MPVKIPEEDPTVAIAGVPLLHTPPAGVLLNVIELPTQTVMPGKPTEPVMIVGLGLTVTL